MTLLNIEKDANRMGIFKVPRGNGETHNRVAWKVVCECGASLAISFNSHTSPELMARNFGNKGWDVRPGKKSKCPTCLHPKRTSPMKSDLKSGVAVGAVAQAPALNPKLMREIFIRLEDYLDHDKKLYREGWSDSRVAKETGASVEVIEKIRKESYFELSEDPEITTLRDDIELFKMEIEEVKKGFDARMTSLFQRLDRVAAGRKV